MEALGGGNGGIWGWKWKPRNRKFPKSQSNRESKSSNSVGDGRYRFPLSQAVTAGSLALTGDTIAQVSERWRKHKGFLKRQDSHDSCNDLGPKSEIDLQKVILQEHDWLRALRMASYGFILYGPGSYAWYQYLDRCLPKQNVGNLTLKVLLNQIVLGPAVISVVFAWNYLWQGKLSQLPAKYANDAFPTLLYGFRFWIPVSILNFWVVPLQARVAFMSLGSIFWNFCLSSTMSK